MLTIARIKPLQRKFIQQVIDKEGREYTDHPDDRGGPTKFGVTLDAYRRYVGDPTTSAEDVKALTEEVAQRIFIEDYFNGYNFELIENEAAYGFILDCSVNHGQRGTVIILQRAVGTRQDGALGKITAREANKLTHDKLMSKLITERGRWYINICERDPTQLIFLEGWFNRLMSFLPY